MCSSSPGRLAASSALGACEIRTIDHIPGEGNSTQADAAEARAVAGEQRLEHLLEAAIDRAHHRHAAEQPFAQIDQRSPDQVGGEETEQRQRDHGDDQAGARQSERQIGFRPVGRRHERPHQIVDPVHEPPGQIEGDRDRPGHNPGRSGNSCGSGPSARGGHPAANHPMSREALDWTVIAVPGRPSERIPAHAPAKCSAASEKIMRKQRAKARS